MTTHTDLKRQDAEISSLTGMVLFLGQEGLYPAHSFFRSLL